MVPAGRLAFISQSGALLTAILDWCIREHVGLSGCVSAGSMLDVSFGELIDHYGQDPNTDSIVIYMESIGDARSFLSAARAVALNKPILVIKAGRTAAAAKAAASHTGSLTGSDDVLNAAFQRAGVLRVNSISEIFYISEVLAKQPRPKGPRLTILTNAGGPGVLATDALIGAGGELTEISPETLANYNNFLPDAWSHNNPVDILGDAEPSRYAKALEIASKDPNTDGMLIILTPQGMTNPTQVAEHLVPYARSTGKPVIASWMGGDFVAEGETFSPRPAFPSSPIPTPRPKPSSPPGNTPAICATSTKRRRRVPAPSSIPNATPPTPSSIRFAPAAAPSSPNSNRNSCSRRTVFPRSAPSWRKHPAKPLPKPPKSAIPSSSSSTPRPSPTKPMSAA